jgi:hypothetical protein
VRHGGLERAGAEPETKQHLYIGVTLVDEVEAGDTAVDDTVLHVLGDVSGTDEEYVDGRVATREGESAVTGSLRSETGIFE